MALAGADVITPVEVTPLHPQDAGVLAWEVTTENLLAVAKWAGGNVETHKGGPEHVVFPVKGELMTCGPVPEQLYDYAFPSNWIVLDADGKHEAFVASCFHDCYVVEGF